MLRILGICSLLWPAAVTAQTLTPIATAPADGTVIGQIVDVDLLPDGRLVVFDGQAMELFVFGRDGGLDATLGGRGGGPGEIETGVEVEVGPAGDLVVVDVGNQRFTRWSADLSYHSDARMGRLIPDFSGWPTVLTWTASGLHLKAMEFMPDRPVSLFTVPADLNGEADLRFTLPTGAEGETCDFCPAIFAADGGLLTVRGDTLYQLLRTDGEGRITHRLGREDLPAVRRSDSELDRLSDAAAGMASRARAEGGSGAPEFPVHKTRFGPHALAFDEQGRVWALPRGAEGEPAFVDVYSAEGSFLRSIELGAPAAHMRIRGDQLIVGSETPIGEPIVRVFRIGGAPDP